MGWCWGYRNEFKMFVLVVGKTCPDRDVSCLAKQRPRIDLQGVKTWQNALDWPAVERAQCYPMVSEESLDVSMHAPVILARDHRNRPPNLYVDGAGRQGFWGRANETRRGLVRRKRRGRSVLGGKGCVARAGASTRLTSPGEAGVSFGAAAAQLGGLTWPTQTISEERRIIT